MHVESAQSYARYSVVRFASDKQPTCMPNSGSTDMYVYF